MPCLIDRDYLEGTDIYQIAKNCRTNLESLKGIQASRIKNTLGVAAINVRKAKRTEKASKAELEEESLTKLTTLIPSLRQ